MFFPLRWGGEYCQHPYIYDSLHAGEMRQTGYLGQIPLQDYSTLDLLCQGRSAFTIFSLPLDPHPSGELLGRCASRRSIS